MSMSFVGLFDVWKIFNYGDEKPGWRRTFFKLYQIGVICLLGLNFSRYFLAYHSFDFGSDLLTTIYVHAWFFLCFAYSVTNYRMVQYPTNLIRFFTQWKQYWMMVKNGPNTPDDGQECSWRQMRKHATIATFVTLCLFIANISFICYLIFHPDSEPNLLEPITNTHELFPLIAGFGLIALAYASSTWMFIATFLIVLSLSVYHEFKNLVLRIEKMTQNLSSSQIRENMEAIRMQHTALCDMLDTGDMVLKNHVGMCIFIHIFNTLLLLYNLCWHDAVRGDLGQLFGHVFWLLGAVSMATIVMAVCSLVNIRAHEPAKFIYNLSMKDITADFALQVNVFLHRLNGPPIGLTAWSLFVIDNQVIVSVAGILATYFVVLLQFQQSAAGTAATSLNDTVA
ncbi:uncharacterized protein LOC117315034 [Pecten maximus]|uniref:uncharacterized protein LOC117315034 n=1 Tax=Pecten maximus TaxID=6579 RepID=UPI001458FED3|nr:uncharacterized protein LOC117315034 [Pecten maximus]